MPYDHLIVEIGDRFVGTITLNRPDQLNTFNTPLAGELYNALIALDQDSKVRVVLIKGAGKAFCRYQGIALYRGYQQERQGTHFPGS